MMRVFFTGTSQFFFFTQQVVSYIVILSFNLFVCRELPELAKFFLKYESVLSVNFQDLKPSKGFEERRNKVQLYTNPSPSKVLFFKLICYRKIETLKLCPNTHLLQEIALRYPIYIPSRYLSLTVQMLENFFKILRHVPQGLVLHQLRVTEFISWLLNLFNKGHSKKVSSIQKLRRYSIVVAALSKGK